MCMFVGVVYLMLVYKCENTEVLESLNEEMLRPNYKAWVVSGSSLCLMSQFIIKPVSIYTALVIAYFELFTQHLNNKTFVMF